MNSLHDVPKFAELGVRCMEKGNSQSCPAAVLGAPKGMRKDRKLTQYLTHTH